MTTPGSSRQPSVEDLIDNIISAPTTAQLSEELGHLHRLAAGHRQLPGWAQFCRPDDDAMTAGWYTWALARFDATQHLPPGDTRRDQAAEIWALALIAAGHLPAAVEVLTGLLTGADDTARVTLRRGRSLALALQAVGDRDRAAALMEGSWQSWQNHHRTDLRLGMRVLETYETLLLNSGRHLEAHRLFDSPAARQLVTDHSNAATYNLHGSNRASAADAGVAHSELARR